MPAFDVYAYYADFCGNQSEYLHARVEAPTQADVERVFPYHPLQGWKVYPSLTLPLPTEVQETPPERHYRGY